MTRLHSSGQSRLKETDMRLYDVSKCNIPNDGTRSIFESILVDPVYHTFKRWCNEVDLADFVLIGGLALSYHGKPRTTANVNVLFSAYDKIPSYVDGFKTVVRSNSFIDREQNIAIRVSAPDATNLPPHIVMKIHETAVIESGVRIASPSGLVVSKLGRFSWQDKFDIAQLLQLKEIDITSFDVPNLWKQRLEIIRAEL